MAVTYRNVRAHLVLRPVILQKRTHGHSNWGIQKLITLKSIFDPQESQVRPACSLAACKLYLQKIHGYAPEIVCLILSPGDEGKGNGGLFRENLHRDLGFQFGLGLGFVLVENGMWSRVITTSRPPAGDSPG